MKITKAQKEAIVNEILRRLEKENQITTDNFNKNYKFYLRWHHRRTIELVLYVKKA